MMRNRSITRSIPLGTILGVLVGLAALAYTAFAATPFISGPSLTLEVEKTETGDVWIHGTTKRVSSVWLNDLPIPITDQGMFSTLRTFPPGYTEIVVRAEDRFGRAREEKRSLVTTQFIDYASQENSEESDQEDNTGTSSTEGNEGGEASSN